jgi:hypothetical protein
MQIHGSPVSLISGPDARFWYWHGASGQKYIHSVYANGECPPLPGAIYVAVRNFRGLRTVMAIGRFETFCETGGFRARHPGVNEIHVHLLARGDSDANRILRDLQAAMRSPDEIQSVRLAA